MRILLIFPIFWVLSGCAVQKTGHRNDTYIVQMTDTQFGFFDENKSFAKETENYGKAVAAVNRLRPDAVFVTGDLVNIPFDGPQVNEYKRISAKIDKSVPFYSLPGNHDVGNEPGPADIARYRSLFGKDYYAVQVDQNLVLVLNSLYLHRPEKVHQEARLQKEWLLGELEKSVNKKYKNILVFLHHPMFLKRADEPDGYFNIPIGTRKEYLSIFKKYGVSQIFAGHYHMNSSGSFEGIEMTTTGPVGKPLGDGYSGLRIIKISGDKISHRYFALDSVPGKLSDF